MPRKAVDSDVRLQSLNLKTTQELRDMLEAASAASGRALTHEVEARLTRTFDFDYLFGDDETALVLRSIANAIRRFELAAGKSWVKDSETQARVHEAVSKMVDVLLEVRPQSDDRKEAVNPDMPVDWNDPWMRAGLRTMALDAAIHDLQIYRRLKEQELVVLRGEPETHRTARLPELPHEVRATQKREAVAKANKENLAAMVAALNDGTPDAEPGIRGATVREQGEDGVSREVPPVQQKPVARKYNIRRALKHNQAKRKGD